jgi:predicted O-methyltransferase YrrM
MIQPNLIPTAISETRRAYMFHDINPDIRSRMKMLEELDARDRHDGTPQNRRLRQIPPETGRFLAILVAGVPGGDIIEVGTSAGYSTLWLSLACATSSRKITTFEILEDKVRLAHETFRVSGVSDRIDLIHGDALDLLKHRSRIAFCFIDAEKSDYQNLYDVVVPRLVSGGLLVADNVISHADTLEAFVLQANADKRVDSVLVPIGKGELVCRKVSV